MKITKEPVTAADIRRAELVAASLSPQTVFEQFERDEQLRAAQVLDDRRRIARYNALTLLASSALWMWTMAYGTLPDLPTGVDWAVLTVILLVGIGNTIRWHGRAKIVRQLRFRAIEIDSRTALDR